MAITEAERLAQALEHFCTNWDGSARHDRKTPLNGLLCCDLRQAAAELRRLSADAQRYAWLRDKANSVRGDAPQVVITDWAGRLVSVLPGAYPQGPELDAAIDQARKETR